MSTSVDQLYDNLSASLLLTFTLVFPLSLSSVSLGVVDSTLSWKPHVDEVTKKFSRVLYSLRFYRGYTTEVLRKRLSEALLFPHLDYCSVIMLDASSEIRSRLQVLQNSCVRYVKGLRRDDHVTPSRASLGWLRTDSRRLYFMAIILYKVMRMHLPEYLESLFSKYIPERDLRGVANRELVEPNLHSETGRRSFQVKGARFWNNIPVSIRNLPSLCQFKSLLKRHLLELD